MDREFHRLLMGLLLASCLSCAASVARAQETDSGDPIAEAKAPLEAPEALIDAKKSPLAADPKTVDELFDAAQLMVDIARFDLARLYLDKLMQETLDDDALLALRDRYGAAAFLKLTNIPELRPASVKLLELSNAAALKQANDPVRIARLIEQLQGDPEAQSVAEAELHSLGAVVVPGLLSVLSNANLGARQESATAAILRIGDSAVPQLIAALEAPSEALRSQVISILGNLRAAAAVPYLWYPATSADEAPAIKLAAVQALRQILALRGKPLERIATEGTVIHMLQSVREQFRHTYPWKIDDTGRVALWFWDDKQKTVVARAVTPEEASDVVGLKFAREALGLAPERRDSQVLYLCLSLAADIRRVGLDKPLLTGPGTAHDLALSVGADVAVDVLTEAFNSTRPDVAVAALKVFSQIGTLDQLNLAGGKRSVVAAALDYPDDRVQFAAATAILQIDPQLPFRGAPRVVEILKRALASNGRPHAVVGEVSAARGALIGGFLRDLGYEPLVYTSGREVFAAAAEHPDIRLVVLHPNIIRWALTETMTNLRADARTANIPIVIHGPSALANKMQRRVENYELVSFSILSETTDDFEYQLKPFLKQIKTAPLTPQERTAQRAEAAAWLAHIAQGRRTKVFEIASAEDELAEALDDEKLAPAALEALGEIATTSSQQRIAAAVADPQANPELRKAAAGKLAFHIQRFGLLLSKKMIDLLHKVWQNNREPGDLRTAVGGIIGSLKPDAILAGKRLKVQAGKTR